MRALKPTSAFTGRGARAHMIMSRFLTLVFAAFFLIVTCAWLTGLPHSARQTSVIREWNSGIGELGITPVFPPREDIQVGDLFLTVGSAGDGGPNSTQIWLADLGFASPIENFYKNRFAMPAENGRKDEAGRLAPPAGSPDGIFKTGTIATRLRSVSFPSFSIPSDRSAKPSVAESVLQFFRSGSFDQSDYDVTVSIPDAESYGIPALAALDAVSNACITKQQIHQLLGRLGVSGQSEVVTQVYYARSIDYTIAMKTGSGNTIAVTPADVDKIKNLVTQIGQKDSNAENTKVETAAPGDGGPNASAAASISAHSASARQDKALLGAIKAELDKMSAVIQGPNAPAVSGTIVRSDARSVTLRQNFAQPVVIGYLGLPAEFGSQPCKQPNRQSALQPIPTADPPRQLPQTFLVFFDWDSSIVSPKAGLVVERVAAQYKATPPTEMRIAGYADLSGSPGYNRCPSERRAEAAAAALERLGVPRSGMIVAGLGMQDPRVPTALSVREPENRRVEITE
jgi:outer membrane protein OmpA-like peptidoglycan-associated protein